MVNVGLKTLLLTEGLSEPKFLIMVDNFASFIGTTVSQASD